MNKIEYKMDYKKQDLSHMPYIKDKECFKAVLFARRLMGTGLETGSAIYRAAKFYKIEVSKVAKYIGKFASNVQYDKTGQEACFEDEYWILKYAHLDDEDTQDVDSYIEDLIRQELSVSSIQNAVLDEFSVQISVGPIYLLQIPFKKEKEQIKKGKEQKLMIDLLENYTIHDLKVVSKSVKKSLLKHGLTRLLDLYKKSDAELLKIEKIGKRALMDIRLGINILAQKST